MNQEKSKKVKSNIDWVAMIVPLAGVLTLLALFLTMPEQSLEVLTSLRGFLGDDIGVYYIVFALFTFGATMYMAFSKYGKIKLGNIEKPQYSSFAWGSMIFTSVMGACLIYFSLSEWAMYAAEPYVAELGDMQLWASTFPLFHWGPLAWSIYVVLAVAFGFMLHVRGGTKQKFSGVCRPLFGDRVDGPLGKFIDIIAIFALIAGAATAFSLATPLLSAAVADVFNIGVSTTLTIILLVMISVIYTIAVLVGVKGIKHLATICVYIFFAILVYFLFLGGETLYIVETGVMSIGNLAQNFIGMATWTDPLREHSFVQDWTVFYWAYWMVFCVSTPFFLGTISKGRTIRNTVLGTYAWGLAGTFTSFIILGNYGLAQQMRHGLDTAGAIAEGYDIAQSILGIVHTLPLPTIALLLLIVNMVMFSSSSFDVIAMVVAGYSQKELKIGDEPDKKIRAFWAILFVLLPIGMLFSEGTLANIQSVAIISAFPIGILIIIAVISFFKDARKYLNGK